MKNVLGVTRIFLQFTNGCQRQLMAAQHANVTMTTVNLSLTQQILITLSFYVLFIISCCWVDSVLEVILLLLDQTRGLDKTMSIICHKSHLASSFTLVIIRKSESTEWGTSKMSNQ